MAGQNHRKGKNTLPKTWRDRLLHTLPHYTGPYNVGYLEIEVPVCEPPSFSDLKRNLEWV